MPTQYGSRLQDLAASYRDALEAQNVSAADRMARGYVAVQRRVDVEVQGLLRKMEAARLAGVDPSPAWLYQQRRLAQVTETIQAEVARWAPLAEEETRDLALEAVRSGERNARTLAREATRVDLPGVEASFTDLNPENMATLMGHLAPGGPVRDLLVRLGGEAAQAAEEAILQGVMLGKGSDWIARGIRRATDIPRWRAETIARTEALRAYRETSRLTYDGATTVGSWIWDAALDRRTCPACVVMHGTEHPTTETLDGHPRCRCGMVPKTKSWAEIDPSLADLPDTRPQVELGKDWLARQSELTQRAVLGPTKHAAWKRGDITLDDVVARTHSPEWGTMRRERSMVEIREGRNANTLPDAPAPTPVRPAPLVEPRRPTVTTPVPEKLPTVSHLSQAELERLVRNADPMDPNSWTPHQKAAHAELQARELKAQQLRESRALAALKRLEEAEAKRLAEDARGSDWEAALPRKPDTPQVAEKKAVKLLAPGGDISRYLEARPGVMRDGADLLISNHESALKGLHLARSRYQEALSANPGDAMTALRLRRVERYIQDVEKGKGGQLLEDWETSNPRYKDGRAWQVNCTNSVSAHELRRRGYDVTASPRPTLQGRYRFDYYRDWGGEPEDWTKEWTVLQMKRHMAKEWPPGARGFVSVTWKGRRSGAHVFSVEKLEDGRLRFLDPQTSQDLGDGEAYWRSARPKVTFLRVDDKPLTERLEDYILRPGETYESKKKG